MVLALDPHVPRVWRSPDTLQFGVDTPRLVLHSVSLVEERMIAALADGVSWHGLRMIARRSRVAPELIDTLLERLAPVLDRPRFDQQPSVTVVDGEGQTAARVVSLLRAAGTEVHSGIAWSDPVVDRATLVSRF